MPVDISIPGSVWDDFLDPNTTTMEAELGLPPWEHFRRGRGWTVRYRNVHAGVARELAEYLRDRAELLLSNSDPEYEKNERAMYRRAIKTADGIWDALRAL